MNGVIKTFLPEKKYGFIKGVDGKDYFFHQNEFRDISQIENICEETLVSFDQKATPKGYQAKNCLIIEPSGSVSFIVPEEFITSRSSSVKGWDIIEYGRWIVHGTSVDSPDAASQDIIDHAKQVRANAIINLEYYKSTGSSGNFRFTVHNFRGRIVTLAKRNARGSYSENDLAGLNERTTFLKETLLAETNATKRKRNIVWSIVAILSFGALALEPSLILIFLVAGFIFGRSTDYDYWLESD